MPSRRYAASAASVRSNSSSGGRRHSSVAATSRCSSYPPSTCTLSGTETVGLPWVVLLAFVRLSTRATVFAAPLTAAEALDIVDGWLDQPCVTVVHPGRRHPAVLRELLAEVGTAGNLVTDAHLAALAVEHGAELCSCDADFSRFPGVRWLDPLR